MTATESSKVTQVNGGSKDPSGNGFDVDSNGMIVAVGANVVVWVSAGILENTFPAIFLLKIFTFTTRVMRRVTRVKQISSYSMKTVPIPKVMAHSTQ
ncbi:hypothetical protein CEW81_22785 [Kluyvera genomosp. 3]|uniref:Uncharacterized protein n=1 Tax=Kluyvera genomosp. 3 TaxID=2774055 RepID=A0A248KKC2_9ENTR|nr:hypothetical protein CEW81_22785 [Kluyvera genomosp. 3]